MPMEKDWGQTSTSNINMSDASPAREKPKVLNVEV
jgi:hypothetical protein